MRSQSAKRAGITLIELLVVLSIMAVLFGLILAAVQRTREAAVRMTNMNNHRQIILGVHQLAAEQEGKITKLSKSSMGSIGSAPADMSIFTRLLPYVHGPKPAYVPTMSVEEHFDVFIPHVRVYRNPADPSWELNPVWEMRRGKISYAYNMMAFDGSVHFASSLPDGASNTISFADKYFARCSADHSVIENYSLYDYLFDPIPNEIYGMRRPTFADAGWRDIMPITDASGVTRPSVPGKTFQVKPRPEEVDPHIPQTPFRSGLTVAFCDGSVRTIAPNVHETVFWALVTPRGGEVIRE